jgi:hypothetical protein
VHHGAPDKSEVEFVAPECCSVLKPLHEENRVQSQNAFIGRIDRPQPEEVNTVLGKSAVAWHQLVQWLIEKESVTEQEWNSFSAKYGWSLKMKKKKRTIIYLGPSQGASPQGSYWDRGPSQQRERAKCLLRP